MGRKRLECSLFFLHLIKIFESQSGRIRTGGWEGVEVIPGVEGVTWSKPEDEGINEADKERYERPAEKEVHDTQAGLAQVKAVQPKATEQEG